MFEQYPQLKPELFFAYVHTVGRTIVYYGRVIPGTLGLFLSGDRYPRTAVHFQRLSPTGVARIGCPRAFVSVRELVSGATNWLPKRAFNTGHNMSLNCESAFIHSGAKQRENHSLFDRCLETLKEVEAFQHALE